MVQAVLPVMQPVLPLHTRPGFLVQPVLLVVRPVLPLHTLDF